MFLEQNQRVFVYEDNLWAVNGCYDAAVADNEAVEWSVLPDHHCLRLFVVCD